MQLRTTNSAVPVVRRGVHQGRAGRCLAFLAAAAGIAAQEPASGTDATPPDVKATEQATEPAAARYARVEVDQQPVRCFESDKSPVYVDQLARGDVVQVGEERNGFVAVTLPLGITGYVHQKFATPPDDQGFVRANGKRVSFRYRPRSNEAPAATLEENAALHFLASERDWYVVRNPRAVGFVPKAALSADLPAAEGAEGWSKLETARREQWQKATAERLAAVQREAQVREQRAQLQSVLAEFRAEVAKPWSAQRRDLYVAMEATASKLAGGFAAGSTDELTVQSLVQEVRKQILVLDAQAVAVETLPPPNLEVTVRQPTVEDPLARFDLVGWVRVVESSLPTRTVRLVRGGRVLGYLTCSNDRYDFRLFDGVEVGVLGPKEAGADGTWLLDVQRMDVVGVQPH